MRGYLGVYLLQLLPFAVYFIILKEEKTNLIEYTKQADNEILEKLDLPSLEEVGSQFLFNNHNLKEINLLTPLS